ncbi:VOC family protein [Pedobacter frigiditerrae]|uniref:VOC family protein n=1 Tax=Pedobacter frigiditerrae TaxID=2530452 RepID=A0A4R0MNR1_9SPHI|nr:VOC family protein [Pedobacter frigiditerrae]TCC88233.1 VOC family protein [Pedobacter frigiditerrae]
MEKKHVLKGLATVNFYATDHQAAKKWYSEFLGIEPYFNVPGYTEFRIGDYQQELGIIDASYAPAGYTGNAAGAIAHWHVDDLKATLAQLISMGATEYLPITDHSQGKGSFVTASVVDPFGNILGIMTNVHYLDILKQKNA